MSLSLEGTFPRGQDTSVWWRVKPPFFRAINNVDEFYNQQFAFREWTAAIGAFEYIYQNAFWINHPEAASKFRDKFQQVRIARDVGLPTPKTLISSSPKDIKEFCETISSRVVHKTITPYVSPTGYQNFTTFFEEFDWENDWKKLSVCPSIFQEYVKPQFEVRLYICNNKAWPIKIDVSDGDIDWRKEATSAGSELIDCPPHILLNTFEFMRRMNIVYGALDFIVDQDGDWVFLECNPSGQWLWHEERFDLDISRALADSLIFGPELPHLSRPD